MSESRSNVLSAEPCTADCSFYKGGCKVSFAQKSRFIFQCWGARRVQVGSSNNVDSVVLN